MSNLTKQQRIATIDLVVPKNNPEVRDAMFSIITGQRWAIDMADEIETAMAEGWFIDLPDHEDLDY